MNRLMMLQVRGVGCGRVSARLCRTQGPRPAAACWRRWRCAVRSTSSQASTSASVVIGRDWSRYSSPPRMAHSMSCGQPKCRATPLANCQRRYTSRPRRQGCRRRPSSTGHSSFAPAARYACLSAITASSTRPVSFSSRSTSGCTRPETTVSPSPQLASRSISRLRPSCGLAVKSTPATSAETCRCTMTAMATRDGSISCSRR